MARGVFFSFHYNDVSEFRANVVRKSRSLETAKNPTTFIDQSLWEEAEKKSPTALKKLIEEGMKGSSVTTILNGSETANRKWVQFDLLPSINNRLKNSFHFRTGNFWRRSQGGNIYKFSELFNSEYCWISNNGYNNFPTWVEKAVVEVGR